MTLTNFCKILLLITFECLHNFARFGARDCYPRAGEGSPAGHLRVDDLPVVRVAAARASAPELEPASLEGAHERRQHRAQVLGRAAALPGAVDRHPAHTAHRGDRGQWHTLFVAARWRGNHAQETKDVTRR
jgi:hypothetical protein